MQRKDIIILKKVLSEISICFEMLGDTEIEAFLTDEKLKRAVSMTVINIGELIKNISEETRLENRQIPWKQIAGMRDIAAHKYQTLRMEDVYNTVIIDLPSLEKEISKILSDINSNSDNESE